MHPSLTPSQHHSIFLHALSTRASETQPPCLHSPQSPSAESFHRPLAPTAAAVIVETPASHPQSTFYVHTYIPLRQSSHLVLRRTMQGRGGYLPSHQTFALPDGAAQAELSEVVSFLSV